MKVCIIIPVFNEEEFIEKSIYDYFLTWGWRDDSKGVYPFIKPFNLGR